MTHSIANVVFLYCRHVSRCGKAHKDSGCFFYFLEITLIWKRVYLFVCSGGKRKMLPTAHTPLLPVAAAKQNNLSKNTWNLNLIYFFIILSLICFPIRILQTFTMYVLYNPHAVVFLVFFRVAVNLTAVILLSEQHNVYYPVTKIFYYSKNFLRH